MDFNSEFFQLLNTKDDEDDELSTEDETSESESEEEENEYQQLNEALDKVLRNISIDKTINQANLTQADYLTEEEKQQIENCRDEDLKKVMLLNRQKHYKLIQIYKKTYNSIREIEAVIEEEKILYTKVKEKEIEFRNSELKGYKLGAPYFKDKDFFRCPLNADYFRRKDDHECSVYDLEPWHLRWIAADVALLEKGVRINYAKKKLLQLMKEQKPLTKSNLDEVPDLNCDDFLDWDDISDKYLRGKFTAEECRSCWNLHVHPKINKSNWTTEEDNKLIELVETNHYQNWDKIVKNLKTNRSGLMACIHFHFKLGKPLKCGKFTEEEDQKLLELVEQYKNGNTIEWDKIESHFDQRNKVQIYHRYQYYLSGKNENLRTGKFTDAEDILLLILVNKFGKNFQKCAQYIPRSQMQIKCHYNTSLEKMVEKGQFTLEEDRKILEFAEKNGTNKWSELAKILNRNRGKLRQRYTVLKRKLKSDPNYDISKIQRRIMKVKDSAHYEFIREMADLYNDTSSIPTLETIEIAIKNSSKKFNNESDDPIKNIDDLLVECFSNSVKLPQSKPAMPKDIEEAVENVKEILICLGVNLDIPKTFKDNPNLDNVDKQILEQLVDENFKVIESDNNKLLPPCLYTIIGLRSILLENKNSKKRLTKVKLKNEWSQMEDIQEEKNILLNRIEKIFYWTSLLSMEKPNFKEKIDEGVMISEKSVECRTDGKGKGIKRVAKATTGQRKMPKMEFNKINIETEDDKEDDLEDLKKLQMVLNNPDCEPSCSYYEEIDNEEYQEDNDEEIKKELESLNAVLNEK